MLYIFSQITLLLRFIAYELPACQCGIIDLDRGRHCTQGLKIFHSDALSRQPWMRGGRALPEALPVRGARAGATGRLRPPDPPP